MSDYIDRDELMKHIKDLPTWWGDGSVTCAFYLTKAITEIENAPAVDVQEVKHGEWMLEREPNGKPYCYHCSVCDNDYHFIGITVHYRYCPNCGAKMDGGDNDARKQIHVRRFKNNASVVA